MRSRRVQRGAPLGLAALGLAGCGGPLSTLEPIGPGAGSIAVLWWVMLAGSAAIFALVMAILALLFLRPGWGAAWSPKAWIVGGGLGLPALVLPPLVAYALVVGETLLPVRGPEPLRIEVTAQQFFWTFRYPEHGGGETTDVLHLPAGEPVDMEIRSRDVIHSFWIPRAAGKLDAVPGHVTLLRLQIDAPGTYEGLCAEFCGLGHTHMRFEIVAHPPEDYAAALAAAAEVRE